MKTATSTAVTATLRAAGLTYQAGEMCAIERSGPHPGDYPAMMLHFHALAIAQDCPGIGTREMRRRVADILEGIAFDVSDIVDDLRGTGLEILVEMAEDDCALAATRSQIAAKPALKAHSG